MRFTRLDRLRHRARVRRLNRVPGIEIDSSGYLAKSAMIQTTSDGVSFGGRLVVSGRVSISEGVILAAYGGSIEIGAGSVVTKAIDACEIAYGVPAVAVRTRRDQRR